MSVVAVFTPMVVNVAWPVVSAMAVSALTSMGYAVVRSKSSVADDADVDTKAASKVEMPVKQSQGFEETLGEEEELVLQRQDITLAFKKGADGKLKVCVSGKKDEAELQAAGKEAVDKFMQAYAHKKIADELKKRGFSLAEERLEDGTIRLKAKKY